MGLITKPNTFTGQTAPQLPWLDADIDTIFNEFNGNINDANIKAAAAIAQSKIANLVNDLAGRVLKSGDTLTGIIKVRMSVPSIFLVDAAGVASGVGDWAIHTSTIAGRLIFFENTGTEAAPTYVERFALDPGGVPLVATDLTTKGYVDAKVAAVGPLAFGQASKVDGDFSTASVAFEDVPGLSVVLTTGARRCRVGFVGLGHAASSANRILSVNLTIDGVDVAGSGGVVSIFSDAAARPQNLSFSIPTGVLTAASHTFQIQVKTDIASSVLRANAVDQALLFVEELPLIV